MSKPNSVRWVWLCVAGLAVASPLSAPQSRILAAQSAAKAPVSGLRLYLFDCGRIMNMDVKTWGFTAGQVAQPHAAVPCHLIVHPKGTLIWDTGVVPDEQIGSGAPGSDRAGQPLRAQLAAIGYRPEDVTYLALSHYHVDHAANSNMFSRSTWLVRQAERDMMFRDPPPPVGVPANYSALRNSKTVTLHDEDYDVFGDGQVTIKAAVGHTPGSQVLILKLPKTGPVMLAGDLYHFPEQRGTDKVPTFEFSKEQTLKSRAMIEDYVKRTGTQLWIEHDFVANAKLKKSPLYYE